MKDHPKLKKLRAMFSREYIRGLLRRPPEAVTVVGGDFPNPPVRGSLLAYPSQQRGYRDDSLLDAGLAIAEVVSEVLASSDSGSSDSSAGGDFSGDGGGFGGAGASSDW